MTRSKVVIKLVKQGLYLSNSLNSLTASIEAADSFDSVEDAQRILLRSLVRTEIEFVTFSTTTVKTLSQLDLVLLRNSHLDATHVGQKGNPYFYYCDEETQKDYCLCGPNGEWVICDHSDNHGDETIKLRSDADKLIAITFGNEL